MNDIEALRESERWLEKLRCYRIAADDSAQSDALVDAALLAVREKLARLGEPDTRPDTFDEAAEQARLGYIPVSDDEIDRISGLNFGCRKVAIESLVKQLNQFAAAVNEQAMRNELVRLKGADGRYVFGDGAGLDDTMAAIRPYLRAALTTESVLALLDQLAEWFDDPSSSRAVLIDDGRLVTTAGYLLRRIRDRLRAVTP